MTLRSSLIVGISALGLLLLARTGAVAAERWLDGKKDRMAALEASAKASEALAAQEHARAEIASQKADSIGQVASALRKRNQAVRVNIVAPAIAAAPDTCKPIIGVLVRFADSLGVEADAWKAKADTREVQIDALTAETGHLRAEADSIREAEAVAKSLLKPSFWKRIKPELGFGAAVGVDPFTGEFSKTVGLTLDWNF